MPDPSNLRDSTQIVVPCASLDDVREQLEQRFTITVFPINGTCKIIGSPVEIKAVNQFLTRHGVTIP
ncbi:hypothetical protein GL213_11495 [Halogeometricum borinquense]|uniref:Uncharacterized protein n=2 Tax=Halogeometricum borinquense TaxID=60847 RepID=E4NQT0_HALBP|nr:hypothetical protein [Halogeometricum borinquense]ADQ67877.1 hypothetical protein Hbor_23170 [Halogeometricum borinquense DSM 11551]ELY24203.1 hypothetical protein C499_16857 [Halogeometricum borinquense DSM 11551]QIB73513.1 hypothetical protein G3I44_03965 [Halogeometricum borinquense]QIQ77092.1 hypothetical protein GL213_11495 [Halogeometricum borinquense]RYJ13220.1 hypothetical protein ELS19_04025 [Halogeometricum borinquense]